MADDALDAIDGQDFGEDIPPEETSIVWHLMKQLRPGMSLAQVTLPTFILEPRSVLARLSDWMCHADILRQIPVEPDPLIRCLHFCTWMVSGFHMGPRRAKKPYNALLGEVFRAALRGPDGDVIGTFIAEQISHHPPISAFRYNDRRGGLSIWGHAEMRSRFYGNSVAALMDHENTRMSLEVPAIGETYDFNFPDLYGRGIIIRPLVYEIVGTVRVRCAQSGVVRHLKLSRKRLDIHRRRRLRRHSGVVVRARGDRHTARLHRL